LKDECALEKLLTENVFATEVCDYVTVCWIFSERIPHTPIMRAIIFLTRIQERAKTPIQISFILGTKD
jgi:hypothetical protein